MKLGLVCHIHNYFIFITGNVLSHPNGSVYHFTIYIRIYDDM